MKASLLLTIFLLLLVIAPPARAQIRRSTVPDFPSQREAKARAAQNPPLAAANNCPNACCASPKASNTLEATGSQPVAGPLQATVVELLDLSLTAQQGRWNLRGSHSQPLREQLQETAEDYRRRAAVLAEQLLQTDSPVDGRPATVAAAANLGEFPAGFLPDQQVLLLLSQRVAAVAGRVRQRMEVLGKTDAVALNQLRELSTVLDKHVGELRAQLQ